MEWYRQKWSCILFLIVFPPLGIYWIWKYHKSWHKNWRIAMTAISAAWFFAIFGIAARVSPKLERLTLLGDELKIGIGETAEIKVLVEPDGAKYSNLKVCLSEDIAVTSLSSGSRAGELTCELSAQKEGDTAVVLRCGDVQSNAIKVRIIDKDKLRKQAMAVEQRIDSIEAVSLSSGEAIASARRAYDALDEDAALLVTNLDDLIQAERALQELQDKAWQRAEEAKKRIEAIGEVGIESEPAIANAREYYDSLPAEVQPLVENYSALVAAEQAYQQQKEAAQQEEAERREADPPRQTKKSEGTAPANPGDASSSGKIVYWTPKGKKYHNSESCPTLSRSKEIRSGTIGQAGGRDLCKVCG